MARDRNRKTEKQTQLRDQGENFQKAIITLREIQNIYYKHERRTRCYDKKKKQGKTI